MNPTRFDLLSRAIANRGRLSRRRAISQTGSVGLAAVLGAAVARRPAAARQDVEDNRAGGEGCELGLTATVRLGPSSERRRTSELAGRLRVRPTASGDLADAEFEQYDGGTYPVRGQATGVAVTLLIGLDDGDVVLTGAGFAELASCRPGNRYSGLLAGPEPGDLGDWQADVFGGVSGVCPEEALCLMDAPCPDDERQTVDCRCVTVGNADCDVECEGGRTLTDDCECVCLVGGDGEDGGDGGEDERGGCPEVFTLECDVECDDDERLTTDCDCVSVGNAVCDVECDEGQTLTDDCACVCLV